MSVITLQVMTIQANKNKYLESFFVDLFDQYQSIYLYYLTVFNILRYIYIIKYRKGRLLGGSQRMALPIHLVK